MAKNCTIANFVNDIDRNTIVTLHINIDLPSNKLQGRESAVQAGAASATGSLQLPWGRTSVEIGAAALPRYASPWCWSPSPPSLVHQSLSQASLSLGSQVNKKYTLTVIDQTILNDQSSHWQSLTTKQFWKIVRRNSLILWFALPPWLALRPSFDAFLLLVALAGPSSCSSSTPSRKSQQ